MKKKILAVIALSSTLVFASQFQVIIKPEQKNFIIGSYKDVTIKSEWQNIGEPTCITDIQEDDVYYGLTATQKFSCEQEQSQNVTLSREYDNGLSKVLNEYVSYQNYAYNEFNEIIGTHLENSCKSILNSGYSIGDNKYYINTGNNTFEVYCNMTTDGGGWTLLQGGKITTTTTNDEFINYYQTYDNYVNDTTFYHLPNENKDTITFKEFKTLHEGETNTYKNHVVMASELSTASSLTNMVSTAILSYKVSNTMNGNSNYYFLSNCKYSSAYKGHISCTGGDETQNPWYQASKINDNNSSGYYGVHTCTRFIKSNGEYIGTCDERNISADLFNSTCTDGTYWHNLITKPTCTYRSNPNSYYKWQEWVR